jgi:hypothetical protein
MQSALENLKKSDPRLFKRFVEALQEDLGIFGEPIASFQCPACRTRFDINAGLNSGTAKGKRFGSHLAGNDSLLELLLELARLKKATTGKIHLEFNKTAGEKLKGMRPPQIREMKREWLKSQVAKYRKKAS